MNVVCDRAALVEALSLAGSVVPSRNHRAGAGVPRSDCRGRAPDRGLHQRGGGHLDRSASGGGGRKPARPWCPRTSSTRSPGPARIPDRARARQVGAPRSQRGRPLQDLRVRPPGIPGVREFAESGEIFECTGGTLRRLIGRTLFATAVENSRFAISGILVEKRGKNLRFVATDGRRLAVAQGGVKGGVEEQTFILPSKPLQILNKLVDDPDVTVQIAQEDSYAIFKVGEGADAAVLSTNLGGGSSRRSRTSSRRTRTSGCGSSPPNSAAPCVGARS